MLLRHGRNSLSLHRAAIYRPLSPTLRCPLSTINASHRIGGLFSTQQDARPVTRRKSFGAGGGFSARRGLATAVDDYQPIDNSKSDRLNSFVSNELLGFDPSSAIFMSDIGTVIPRARMNLNGIPGDVEEMLPVFDACLRVGKVDRAEMILKRLSGIDAFPREDLILLHDRYLRASLDQMRVHPDRKQAESLHRWYEMYIRSKGLPQTAETIACMLKASLLSEREPSRLGRLITRYMGMAPGEAGLHVLSMADILCDQDLAVITDICPTYNLASEDTTKAATMEETKMSSTSYQASSIFDDMPDVSPTPQKGVGLKTVKQTLSLFDGLGQQCDVSTLPLHERREIQARLEQDTIDAAVGRWREETESLRKMGLNTAISHTSLNSRLYDWHIALEARLKEEMVMIEASEAAHKKTQEDYNRCLYGPFLRLSSPSRLAAVTILAILNAVTVLGVDRGIAVSTAVTSLAKSLEEDIRAQAASQKAAPKTKRKRVVLAKPAENATADATPKEADTPLLNDELSRYSILTDAPWPVAVRTKIAAAMISALIDTATITVVKEHPETKTLISQSQPAFSHATQLKKGKKVGMFLLNKELTKLLRREPMGDFLAKHLPMVVEPEPWVAFDKGAFLHSRANVVRVKQGDKDQRLYTEAAIARGDMDLVLKGLDVLGKTPWKINVPVLNVMLEAWNSGQSIGKLPALNPDFPTPPEPAASEDPVERRKWIRAIKAAENLKSGVHSARCFLNFQLEIARAFRNQTFYFPHNVDFRGRAYPLPVYLNHMGADHSRGILCFARGRELGERGLEWLKVQLANVYGFDKASIKDRASFAMDNLVNIFDSANKPLTGNRWWLKAEDPWQCLATCFELKAALESPDPKKYVSHLPVHQDGTCNGLQHYAALGGDTWGARQVNLEPGDKPADVYSAVADIVKDFMAKDVEAGNVFAMVLNGKITRKVVKQTVMTNVYGVTYSGARKQVCKQLEALYPDLAKEHGVDHIVLASYVATLVFRALSSMFSGAHDIQHWLGEVGGRICKAVSPEQLARFTRDGAVSTAGTSSTKQGREDLLAQFRATIVWTTPLRMPVSQPYRKSGTRVIKTSLQDLSMTIPERSDPVHRRKQLQAFPPNFIHSLDATHMLLSALECGKLGLDFAAVHDSFWTHAADVDVMNRVLREAFVRIHEEDVIGRLAAEFKARYRGSIYLADIKVESLAGKKILELRKRSKMTMKDELLQEYKRQKLLRSTKQGDFAEAKNMVTPASIFEEMSDVESLAQTDGLEAQGLGEISEEPGETELNDGIVDEIAVRDTEEATGSSVPEELMESMGRSHFEDTIVTVKPSRKKKRAATVVQAWLPLTFPDVPKKGDFDVQRLKQSDYFFS